MTKRTQFGPFRGYTSAVERRAAPQDFLVGPTDGTTTYGSLNMELDPFTGKVFRRRGCAIVGDTVVDGVEQSGLLPAKWSAKARRIFPLKMAAMTDGYPSHAVLYTKEDQSASFPAVDTGYFSNLYARLNSTNWTLLSEFGTNGYPTATGTEFMLKVEPLWYESGLGGYTRGAHELARRFLASGSRDVLEAGDNVYLPNLRGTPARWNGEGNASSASVTQRVRLAPTGPWGPAWGPTVTLPAALGGGATATNWVFKEGDCGYVSVLFRYKNGSYSAPYLPKASEAFVFGTPGGTGVYASIELTNIPVGGPEVDARLILMTEVTTLTATIGAVGVPKPGELRVVGLLDDNTRTSFSVTLRNPTEIPNNDSIVRYDLVCPRRAAHIGTGDQRAIVGRTLPSPCAIQIFPTSANAAYDLNYPDDHIGLYGSTCFSLRLTSTNLELFKTTGTGTAQDFVAPGNGVQFALGTYTTLQSLVDAVNATTTSSLCGGWRAAVAPGVDPTTASSSLLPTTSSVAGCTTATSTTLTTSNSFADVAIGALVSGTNIAAGTYVKSKESATSITLSQATTGNGAGLTITFSFDLGDDYLFASTERGYMRCFGTSYRGILYFKRTALKGYDKVNDRSVYFTVSSPGAAATGVSLAPDCWPADNRRDARKRAGAFMGVCDIEGAALCAWRNRVDLLVNVRGVNTGEDFDIRLLTVNGEKGCISWPSLTSANGAAFYLTEAGIKATDKGRREVNLTPAIYNPTTGAGDLAAGVVACVASSAADTDAQSVSCAVLVNRLALVASGRVLLYDFAPGVSASGLDALVEPSSQQPYGWSPPSQFLAGYDFPDAVTLAVTTLGAVPKSDGVRFYAASDTNAGTGDGRVEQVYTGDIDNDVVALGYAYTAELVAEAFTRLSVTRCVALHSSYGNANALFYLRHYRKKGDYSVAVSYALSSENAQWQQQEVPFTQGSQAANAPFMAFVYVSTTTSLNTAPASAGTGWWGLVVEYDELET